MILVKRFQKTTDSPPIGQNRMFQQVDELSATSLYNKSPVCYQLRWR